MPIFQLPRTLFHFGAIDGVAAELAVLGARRPLIVSDRGVEAVGIVATAVRALEGTKPSIFAKVAENPTFADVDAAYAHYVAEDCDAVIALGGGSVIDTAKIVAVLASHKGRAADYVGFSERVTSRVAPLIVVPTTAGTGSESSPDAGIHPAAETPSSGISSWHVVPHVTILDPALTFSLPASLTAATGLDALSHCIEGYLSTTNSPLADALALDGIAKVLGYLERATRDGFDREARWNMMAAAYAGGAAISKGLGPAHAIAITCGDQGFHHGKLSALGLIGTLDLVRPHAVEKFRRIAIAMGLSPDDDPREAVVRLCLDLGLPVTLAGLGYRARNVGALGRAAWASHFNMTSPYHPTADEYSDAIGTLLQADGKAA